MNQSVEKIVADLCAFEPELKVHEEALKKIVAELQTSRPDVQFDSTFARELKTKLMKLELTGKPIAGFDWKRSVFAFGSVAVALALVLVVITNRQTKTLTALSTIQVKHVADNAFGSLLGSSSGSVASSEKANTASPTTAAVAPTAMNAVQFGRGGGGGGVSSKIMMPYVQYKYVYKGDKLSLTEANLDVLKRQPLNVDTSGATAVLNQFGFGGVSLGTFTGKLTSFELTETKDKGYVVSVNVSNGTININQNWSMWPQYTCDASGVCNTPVPLKPSEVPADADIAQIATQFLQSHGVQLSTYGDAQVDSNWRLSFETPDANGGVPYVPDVVTVLYPLKVNDKLVYDVYGNKVGLSVNVDIRQKVVTSAWNITSLGYDASQYGAETDESKVIAVAERGGIYGWSPAYYEGASKVEELYLGTPSRVLAQVVQSNGISGNELVVPALYFPVTNIPKDQPYMNKGIIVPLIKEVLNQGNDGGGIRPLMKTEAAPALLK